jgi:protein tyrosine phosphatase
MGAEQSGINSSYKDGLTKDQLGQMKSAELNRKKSMSLKRRKSSFLGDVTSYPDRVYNPAELQNISTNLGERLNKLNEHMQGLGQNDLAGFIREYTTIMEGRDKTSLASHLEPHKALNRYNNITAYDETRVKITPKEESGNTDYVNANHIHGYNHPNKYIASQGPVPAAFNGFWQMIWENKIPTIVMVTNEVEGGKLKCHRYWPEGEQGNMKTYGAYNIQMTDQEVFTLYIKRKFNLTEVKTRETREVIQYCYTAWPDHGVPDTTQEVLQFRTTVKKDHPEEDIMCVHCSAGVGRTGTFIGLDRYLDSCADLNDDMTVLDLVREMRSARNFMVQAQAQYVYLYEASRDGLSMLYEKASREAGYAQANEEEKQQVDVQELEEAITVQEEVIRQDRRAVLRDPRTVAQTIVPDVTKEFISATPYTADIHTTGRIPQNTRRTSLASSTTQWVERRNVPMSPGEHGYETAVAAPITSRLMALSDARTAWMTRYSDAERTWTAQHDAEGVTYEVGTQMSPMESRVSSLAAAEEAWKLRSGSSLTLAEERARLELNDLTKRLESLQFTVLNSERRWRSTGHGFAPSNQGPDASKESIHTCKSAICCVRQHLGLLQRSRVAY